MTDKNPDTTDYDAELTAWAESDAAVEAALRSPNIRRGEDGRAETLALLIAATEDDPEGRALLERVLGRTVGDELPPTRSARGCHEDSAPE